MKEQPPDDAAPAPEALSSLSSGESRQAPTGTWEGPHMGRRGFLVAGVAGAAAGVAVVGGAAAWLFSHQGIQTTQRERTTATTGASATPTEQPTPTATPQLPSTYEQAWDNKDGRTLALMFADGIRLTDNSPQPAPYGIVGARRLDGTDFFAQTPAQTNEATFINADRQGYYVNAPYLGYREELQTSGVNQGKVAIILIIGGVVHPGRTAADALKDTIYKRRVFAGFKGDRSKDAYIGVIFQDILSDNTTSGQSIFPDGFTDNPSTNNLGIHKGMSLVLTFANSDKIFGKPEKGRTDFLSALVAGKVPESDEDLSIDQLPHLYWVYKAL